MSLYKQLWLAVAIVLTIVFGGSFLVVSYSAKAYLEEQLGMRNSHYATALALSLSQQKGDEVLSDVTLAVQFDLGYYEMIEFLDPLGGVIGRRDSTHEIADAPAWFMALFPIESEPGVAPVLNKEDWTQRGTVRLRSHADDAYGELWQSTKRLALLFVVAMIAAGFVGSQLLRIILRPLDDVVEQAQAIGERRFITVREPETREFRQVVGAMNNLSQRIKTVLGQEAERIEKWQRAAHIDQVTGLVNREPFVQMVNSALESDDVNATGSLSIVKITGLVELNNEFGRKAIDGMLSAVGSALNSKAGDHSRWAAARLNGSDLALLAPRAHDPSAAVRDMQAAIREVLEDRSMDEKVTLPAASIIYSHGDTFSSLMTQLDDALQASHKEGVSAVNIANKEERKQGSIKDQLEEWGHIFSEAFREKLFSLAFYPVLSADGQVIHYEAPVKLTWQGKTLAAGQFLPWINRLEVSGELDREVITMAIALIQETGKPVCANLSVASVVEPEFVDWLGNTLSRNREAAEKLWLDVPEAMAFRHLQNFKRLCEQVKTYNSKVGIEHMGHQLSELGQVHDVGLDFLKVDAGFVRDIENNIANQTLFRTLCTIGHSIGVIVIGEGVRTDAEWASLRELGADGATGPGITE